MPSLDFIIKSSFVGVVGGLVLTGTALWAYQVGRKHPLRLFKSHCLIISRPTEQTYLSRQCPIGLVLTTPSC